jgi:hypothetical protein
MRDPGRGASWIAAHAEAWIAAMGRRNHPPAEPEAGSLSD